MKGYLVIYPPLPLTLIRNLLKKKTGVFASFRMIPSSCHCEAGLASRSNLSVDNRDCKPRQVGARNDIRRRPSNMHIHLLHSLDLLSSKVLVRPSHNSFGLDFLWANNSSLSYGLDDLGHWLSFETVLFLPQYIIHDLIRCEWSYHSSEDQPIFSSSTSFLFI